MSGGAGFLPSTVIPENWPFKRKVVSQPPCFRGELLVSESANVVHMPPICWVGPFTISFGVWLTIFINHRLLSIQKVTMLTILKQTWLYNRPSAKWYYMIILNHIYIYSHTNCAYSPHRWSSSSSSSSSSPQKGCSSKYPFFCAEAKPRKQKRMCFSGGLLKIESYTPEK